MSKHLAPPLFVVLILTAGCAAPGDPNVLLVSGHVEATEIVVASEVGGRLLSLDVAEGNRVEAGMPLARIATTDTELEADRARAERAAADARLRLLRAGARGEDLREAQARIAALEAELAAREADTEAAAADLERFEALLAADAGSRKQRDDAAARVAVGRESGRAIAEQAQAARETLSRLEAGARTEEIDAAAAQVTAIDAQLAVLQKRIADASVVSPASGIVTETLVEAGELVAPRVPLLIVTDLDRAWANLFVPEPYVPRIQIGQETVVHTDAGGEGLPGTVTFISSQAEFTPRNVQTADERSRLVYRIKVAVDNRAGVLKPGMPVDATLVLP